MGPVKLPGDSRQLWSRCHLQSTPHRDSAVLTLPTLVTAAIKVPQQSPPLGSFCLNRRDSNVGGEGGTQRVAFKMD